MAQENRKASKTKKAVKTKAAKSNKNDEKKAKPQKTVIVTGAAGFVGTSMVEELVDAGYKVIATDLPGSNFAVAQKAGAKIIEADLTDPESLKQVFKGKIDYVVHIGALYNYGAKRQDLMRVNGDGTRNVAHAALGAGVKHFIYFSTGDIHGQVSHIMTEDTPANPMNAYAESKLEGERAAWELRKKNNLPLTVLRPTVVYGPRSRYIASNFMCVPGIVHAVGAHINLYKKELPVFSGGPLVSWVHVLDLTGAVRFMLGKKQAIGNVYNVCDDNPMTITELFSILFDVFGYEWIPAVPFPGPIVAFFGRVGLKMPTFIYDLLTRFMTTTWNETRDRFGLSDDIKPNFARDLMTFMLGDRTFDNSRIKALGYKLRYPDSRAGFRETIEWYRKHNWLPNAEDVWAED